MRASIRACLLFAVAAIVALQVAQPVSAGLVDREVFENISPALYDIERRQEGGTAVPSSTSTGPAPTATIGAGCRNPSDCVSGHCSRSENRCLPAPGNGAINDFCTRDYQCTGGAYCYRGSCQYIKPNGSNCYKDSGCASSNCYKKKCQPRRNVANGERCTQSLQCVEGSFCNRSRCATLRGNGEYCYKNQGCTSGVCNSNRCSSAGLARLGQRCSANSNCRSGSCFKGACRAKRAAGQPCSTMATCLSNRCVNSVCQ